MWKISHLTNSEIARLADASVGFFCYTVGVGQAFPGATHGIQTRSQIVLNQQNESGGSQGDSKGDPYRTTLS
jgi:hypothetical protein